MPTPLDLLDKYIFSDVPSNAVYDLIKTGWQKANERTWVELCLEALEQALEDNRPGGYLGSITSCTGYFLTSYQKWREEILLQEVQLIALADLGYGVLDTARVETAAYVLKKTDRHHSVTWSNCDGQ